MWVRTRKSPSGVRKQSCSQHNHQRNVSCLCGRPHSRTNNCTGTLDGVMRHRRRFARPKPKRWHPLSARHLDSIPSSIVRTTFNSITATPRYWPSQWSTSRRRRRRFSKESMLTRVRTRRHKDWLRSHRMYLHDLESRFCRTPTGALFDVTRQPSTFDHIIGQTTYRTRTSNTLARPNRARLHPTFAISPADMRSPFQP